MGTTNGMSWVENFFNFFICYQKNLNKLDLYTFTDFDQLNIYLLKKCNIPAFQHCIIHRLSIFSFKMLNFFSTPKI